MSWKDKLFGGKQEQENTALGDIANAKAKPEKGLFSEEWRLMKEHRLGIANENADLIKTVIKRISAIDGVDLNYSEKVVNQDVVLSVTASSKRFKISIGEKELKYSSSYIVDDNEGRKSIPECWYVNDSPRGFADDVGHLLGRQYPHKAAKIDAVVERTFRFEQINDKGAGRSR